MKTNDKDIEKIYEQWAIKEDRHDGLFSNANSYSRDDYFASTGFMAGFKACEAKMMEDVANAPLAVRDFEEWWATTSLPEIEDVKKGYHRLTFTAGRFSGLKEREERIKELERVVKKLIFHHETRGNSEEYREVYIDAIKAVAPNKQGE